MVLIVSCLTLLASTPDVKCESRKAHHSIQAGSSLYLLSQVCMDFLRVPRNLELYVVGKLLTYSVSEFIAGIANPRTLRIKKCYFTCNC